MAAATKRTGVRGGLLLTLALAAPLLIAPPIIRGLAAARWVTHYGSLETLPRPRRVLARTIVQKTDVAIQNLAPLPQASAAAILALRIGERTQYGDLDPEAALLIYRGVRASCERARSRPFWGAGFAVIAARAAALEEALTAGVEK